MMEKKNWIFDLYGTLIDIHTDENNMDFWKRMTEFYQIYGAVYTPAKLRDTYRKLCREEERKLKDKYQYPEIDLMNVFERLLNEAEHFNCMYVPIHDIDWNYMMANTFRTLSRDMLKVYPGVREVLQTLKDQGCHIYLLSNAQAAFTMCELGICDLKKYFDGIYISSNFGVKKPDPAFMDQLLCMSHLSVHDCVMVGNDFSSDIAIAEKVGMDSIFLNTDRYTRKEINLKQKGILHQPKIIYSGRIEEILQERRS